MKRTLREVERERQKEIKGDIEREKLWDKNETEKELEQKQRKEIESNKQRKRERVIEIEREKRQIKR